MRTHRFKRIRGWCRTANRLAGCIAAGVGTAAVATASLPTVEGTSPPGPVIRWNTDKAVESPLTLHGPDGTRRQAKRDAAVREHRGTLTGLSTGTRVAAAGAVPVVQEERRHDTRVGESRSAHETIRRHTLRSDSIDYPRTCVHCRRLMEARRYRESIAQYRRFLEQADEHAARDDALLQIAHIYDRYLFDYAKARAAYNELLARFPQAVGAEEARIRLDYLRQHSDHDYSPLRVFEKAKLLAARNGPEQWMDSVEAALKRYPRNSLRDEMLFWLSETAARRDADRAFASLARLCSTTTDPEVKRRAEIARADLSYKIRDYHRARDEYRRLIARYGENASQLDIRLHRSLRNIRRRRIRAAAIVTLVLVTVLVLSFRPRKPSLSSIVQGAVSGAVLLAAALVLRIGFHDVSSRLFPFFYWLAGSMGVAGMITAECTRKISPKMGERTVSLLVTLPVAVVIALSVLYVLLYRFHFLIAFERLLQ